MARNNGSTPKTSTFAILKKRDPSPDFDTTNDVFEKVAEISAKTSGQALRSYCSENNVSEGTFAVVSTRNFAPKTISVETRTSIKVG